MGTVLSSRAGPRTQVSVQGHLEKAVDMLLIDTREYLQVLRLLPAYNCLSRWRGRTATLSCLAETMQGEEVSPSRSTLVVPTTAVVQPSPARPSLQRLEEKNNGLTCLGICMSWCAGHAAVLRAGDIVPHTQEPARAAPLLTIKELLPPNPIPHAPALGACTVTQYQCAAVASRRTTLPIGVLCNVPGYLRSCSYLGSWESISMVVLCHYTTLGNCVRSWIFL